MVYPWDIWFRTPLASETALLPGVAAETSGGHQGGEVPRSGGPQSWGLRHHRSLSEGLDAFCVLVAHNLVWSCLMFFDLLSAVLDFIAHGRRCFWMFWGLRHHRSLSEGLDAFPSGFPFVLMFYPWDIWFRTPLASKTCWFCVALGVAFQVRWRQKSSHRRSWRSCRSWQLMQRGSILCASS